MRCLALLALCACDAVFGIHNTRLEHGEVPIDAPFMCPTSGAPTFSRQLQQVVSADCWSFTPSESSGLAAMACHGGDFNSPATDVAVVGSLATGQDLTV